MRSKRLISANSSSLLLLPIDEPEIIKEEPQEEDQEINKVSTYWEKGTPAEPYPELPIVPHRTAATSKATPDPGEQLVLNPERMLDSSKWASKRRAAEYDHYGKSKKKKKGDDGKDVIYFTETDDTKMDMEAGASRDQRQREIGKRTLWEGQHEVKLLRCFQEYLQKIGRRPEEFFWKKGNLRPSDSFCEFVKEKAGFEGKELLTKKIRRLRERYRKMVRKEEEGKTLLFAKPHAEEVFLLSMDIWGEKEKRLEESHRFENEHYSGHKVGSSSEIELESVETIGEKLNEIVPYARGDDDLVETTKESVKVREVKRRSKRNFGDSGCPMPSLGELIEKGLESAKSSKLRKLEKQQRELEIATLRVHLERQKLDVRKTKLALKGLINGSNR